MKYPAYLLSLMLLPGWAFAQTDVTPAPEKPEKTSSAPAKAAPNTADSKPASAAKKKPAKARPAPRFTPSEKIRADQAVAFPVDI